jgi:hypothetical protein
MQNRYPWLWDVEMDEAAFAALLRDEQARLPYDQRWAVTRLLEYAPYSEIRRLLPEDVLTRVWPKVAPRLRSQTRRAGMEFVCQWLQKRRILHA